MTSVLQQPDENWAYIVPNFINGTRKNLKDSPVKKGCGGRKGDMNCDISEKGEMCFGGGVKTEH
jgi:hypothetical protein